MKIIKSIQIEKEPIDSPLFTGPEVTRQVLLPDSKAYDMSIVSFGKGVRNKFHKHDAEQVLIVTSGKGIVATEEEEYAVGVGDIISIPAGQKHWHGAVAVSEFAHIYVIKKGSELTQLED